MKKLCHKCQKHLSIDRFGKNKLKPGGLQSACRKCRAVENSKWYQNNIDKARLAGKLRTQKRKSENRERLFQYLLKHPCVDCGEQDPIVLHFDHMSNKKYNVSKMLTNGMAWVSISKEIEKCQVRCSNCHMRKTAKSYGWAKALM